MVFTLFSKLSFSFENNTDSLFLDSLIQQKNISIPQESIKHRFKILNLNKLKINKQKLTALILDILTGPVGGHRMALGTKPIVPIFYAITIGGGFFLLPTIDFFVILFTKDISKYQNNDKIIMWLN